MAVDGRLLPDITVVTSTKSTNDDVMVLGQSGAEAGTCVMAYEQTAGRGQRGRVWQSPASGLFMSVLLRPQIPMSFVTALPVLCSLGVLDALTTLGAENCALKWFNDIVTCCAYTPYKLAGVLVEVGTGEAGMFAVCGIGVNLSVSSGFMSHESAHLDCDALPPGSLAMVLRSDADQPAPKTCAETIRHALDARIARWERSVAMGQAQVGPLAPVLSEYVDVLWQFGKAVRAVAPDGHLLCQGQLAGVDAWGRITLITAQGTEVVLAPEQASLRPIRRTM